MLKKFILVGPIRQDNREKWKRREPEIRKEAHDSILENNLSKEIIKFSITKIERVSHTKFI